MLNLCHLSIIQLINHSLHCVIKPSVISYSFTSESSQLEDFQKLSHETFLRSPKSSSLSKSFMQTNPQWIKVKEYSVLGVSIILTLHRVRNS